MFALCTPMWFLLEICTDMAKKRSTRKKKASSATSRRGTLLKDATLAQLEKEIAKRREQELAALEKERAELDARITAVRGSGKSPKAASARRQSKASSNGRYWPREGSHGDLVLKALAEGGEWSLDDLSSYTGAGKPTISVSVLPKLIREGLAVKARRGKYSKAG